MDSGGRPVWREAWFAPVITTLVLIGVIASLIFTFLNMQKEERARVTASELLEGRKSVDFRLRGNLDYLALLGKEWASGALDDESFQRRTDAYGRRPIQQIPRDLWASMQQLERPAVDERLDRYLRPVQIGAIFTRRDRLVEHFRRLIAERGEEAVLIDPLPRR